MNSYNKDKQEQLIDLLSKKKTGRFNPVYSKVASMSAKEAFLETQKEMLDQISDEQMSTINTEVAATPVKKKDIKVSASKKIAEAVNSVADRVTTSALLERSLVEWRTVLAPECQVYKYGTKYFAKRYDHINYMFVSEDGAKEIVTNNLYALLKFKYFPALSDDIDDKITDIVKSFTKNLDTTLQRITFLEPGQDESDEDGIKIRKIPNWCVAFKNGVYNFKDNEWLFRYDIKHIDNTNNKLYMYDFTYAILWYFNFDFEPIEEFDIMSRPLEDFIDLIKMLDVDNRNLAFELIWNMSCNSIHKFDLDRFSHLCQILGYTIMQGFVQLFVFFMGSGGNGKNSLFDGCFSNRVKPEPSQLSLTDIEGDKFVLGSIENHYQNIYLETEADVLNKSKVLKQITGSTNQTVEHKGIDRYQSQINCKFVFAGNDQDEIKFKDNTPGFLRRINIFEIYYRWDKDKNFLKLGDYYDTTFDDNLTALKKDKTNTLMFIYFAMYGIKIATNNFEDNFRFTKNDWNYKYSALDLDLKEDIESITLERISKGLGAKPSPTYAIYDSTKKVFHKNKIFPELGLDANIGGVRAFFEDDESAMRYFAENDIYISFKFLSSLISIENTGKEPFKKSIMKLYPKCIIESCHNNENYVLVSLSSGRLKIKERTK